jgi:hypothetical protein
MKVLSFAGFAVRRTLLSLVTLIALVAIVQVQAQVHPYTPQEMQNAGGLLLQRHPDSIEFLKSIDEKTPLLMPTKDQSAYEYMFALYTLSREKRGETEIDKKKTEEASKAVQQLQDNHPDFAQSAPRIVKLLPAFPQRTGESLAAYLERLYRMAKEE